MTDTELILMDEEVGKLRDKFPNDDENAFIYIRVNKNSKILGIRSRGSSMLLTAGLLMVADHNEIFKNILLDAAEAVKRLPSK